MVDRSHEFLAKDSGFGYVKGLVRSKEPCHWISGHRVRSAKIAHNPPPFCARWRVRAERA